jgi:hypothetical protein
MWTSRNAALHGYGKRRKPPNDEKKMDSPECHLKLEKLDKLAFRAVDSDFPGLEGLGADKIEAPISEGQDDSRERNTLSYVEFLRGIGNEPWQPWEDREINQMSKFFGQFYALRFFGNLIGSNLQN